MITLTKPYRQLIIVAVVILTPILFYNYYLYSLRAKEYGGVDSALSQAPSSDKEIAYRKKHYPYVHQEYERVRCIATTLGWVTLLLPVVVAVSLLIIPYPAETESDAEETI